MDDRVYPFFLFVSRDRRQETRQPGASVATEQKGGRENKLYTRFLPKNQNTSRQGTREGLRLLLEGKHGQNDRVHDKRRGLSFVKSRGYWRNLSLFCKGVKLFR